MSHVLYEVTHKHLEPCLEHIEDYYFFKFQHDQMHINKLSSGEIFIRSTV